MDFTENYGVHRAHTEELPNQSNTKSFSCYRNALVTLELENSHQLLHPVLCLSLSPSHWPQVALFLNLLHSLLSLFHFRFFYIPSFPTSGAKPSSFHLLTQNHVAFSFIALIFPHQSPGTPSFYSSFKRLLKGFF